jgi:2-polyprenyl-6-hydroxyphenyl methylase/3-demethylubiquinone-9 3-methyltransferase
MAKLKTLRCENEKDIREFFEQTAKGYQEMHGHPEKLFHYRMQVVAKHATLGNEKVLLDLGCGNGHHLFYLSAHIKKGIGIDFAAKMIEKAQQAQQEIGNLDNLEFRVDRAQELKSLEDQSVDIVICIGSFEHMLHKNRVLEQVYRILKENGRFILLTPNGQYVWYRWLAPLFGLQTRHLSTDQFLPAEELKMLLAEQNYAISRAENWTFIPRGDMNRWQAMLLSILDFFGKIFKIGVFRGGVVIRADKMR